MNIYFPLETQQRELDARILFCINAAKLGHKAYFGHKSDVFPLIPKLEKGIFVHKSIQKRKLDQINFLNSLGHFNCSIDEEALMIDDEEEYFNYRCSRDCLDSLDLFLAWGENHKRLISKKYPEFKNKIISAGNSRIDILKYKKNHKEFVSQLKKKYGKFILIVSKFARHNLKKRGWDTWLEMKLANAPHLSKRSYLRIVDSTEFEKRNMELIMKTIIEIAKEYPNRNIIIRPHPAEDISTWNDFASRSGYSNIKVVFTSQSLNPWLLAAENVISSNCTSSLEALILGANSLNYIPYMKEHLEYELPKICSHTVRNFEQIKYHFNNKSKFLNDKKLLREYIKNYGNKSFCDYLLDFLNENIDTSLYCKKNNHLNFIILFIQKINRRLKKYISLNLGPLRRRKEIAKQKFPGFSLKQVKRIAKLYEIPHYINIQEAWPGVFVFKNHKLD